MGIATINPATGETVKTFTALTDAEIENALALADRAFRDYRRVSFDTRSQWMQNAANLLEENAETYAKIMTLEMGKPITAAIAEVKKKCLRLSLLCGKCSSISCRCSRRKRRQ